MTETRAAMSSTVLHAAPLPPPLVTTAFSTVIAKWQFPDEDAEVLAKAAAAEFVTVAATQPAGTHPQRLNNDFFDHQTAYPKWWPANGCTIRAYSRIPAA